MTGMRPAYLVSLREHHVDIRAELGQGVGHRESSCAQAEHSDPQARPIGMPADQRVQARRRHE